MELTGYVYVVHAAVVLGIAAILFFFRRNPVVALYVIAASLLFKGQYIWVGNPLFPWQFAGLIGLVYFLRRDNGMTHLRHGPSLGRFYSGHLLFFFYTFLISGVMWVFLSMDDFLHTSEPLTISRVFTQSLYTCLLFGLFIAGIHLGRHLSAGQVLRAIVTISSITAFFAIVQVVVFKLSGINIFPIIGSDDLMRSAYLLDTTFRATSFTGEPKHLGVVMAFGLTCLFLLHLFRMLKGNAWILQAPLMVLGLVLSLSATGFYLLLLGIVLASTIFFRRLRVATVTLLLLAAASAGLQNLMFDDVFIEAVEQQASKLSFEVQDQSVWLALLDNPFIALAGSGLGNIHFYAVDYLPPEFPLFRDAPYKANSGLFFVIGDSGIIGLLLLAASALMPALHYRRSSPTVSLDQRRELGVSLALYFTAFGFFLLRFSEMYYFLGGITVAVMSSASRRVPVGVARSPDLHPKPLLGADVHGALNSRELGRS